MAEGQDGKDKDWRSGWNCKGAAGIKYKRFFTAAGMHATARCAAVKQLQLTAHDEPSVALGAQVLVASQAVAAAPAGVANPADTHAVALFDALQADKGLSGRAVVGGVAVGQLLRKRGGTECYQGVCVHFCSCSNDLPEPVCAARQPLLLLFGSGQLRCSQDACRLAPEQPQPTSTWLPTALTTPTTSWPGMRG